MIVRLIHIYANNIFYSQNKAFLYKIVINYLLLPFFMLFIHVYKILFFNFFCFPVYDDIYPKYCQSNKKDVGPGNQKLYLWKLFRFSVENNYHSIKRLKKKTLIFSCKQINRKNTWSS